MKKLTLSAISAALLSTTAFVPVANAEVSANIGVTSNYLWRGVSQSADGASISGGIDYSAENGFYAGTWIGSIDWGVGNGYENDIYFGYAGETDNFSYDVGYIFYNYPESEYDDSNFGEIYFNGGVDDFSFGAAYTVNSDVDKDAAFGTGDLYLSAGYSLELSNDYGLSLTVGRYIFDTPTSDDEDYTHFQADISKGDFTFTISKAQESGLSDDDLKLVVSWGMGF